MKLNPLLKLAVLSLFCVVSALGADVTRQVYTNWPFDAAEAAWRQTETAQVTKQPVVLKTLLSGKAGPVLTWRLIPAGGRGEPSGGRRDPSGGRGEPRTPFRR